MTHSARAKASVSDRLSMLEDRDAPPMTMHDDMPSFAQKTARI
jgi:hypothetical protein